jgi:hypothetical protein
MWGLREKTAPGNTLLINSRRTNDAKKAQQVCVQNTFEAYVFADSRFCNWHILWCRSTNGTKKSSK